MKSFTVTKSRAAISGRRQSSRAVSSSGRGRWRLSASRRISPRCHLVRECQDSSRSGLSSREEGRGFGVQNVAMKRCILILLRLFHVLLSMSDLIAFCVSASLVAVRFGFGEQLFHGCSSTHLEKGKAALDVRRSSLINGLVDRADRNLRGG